MWLSYRKEARILRQEVKRLSDDNKQIEALNDRLKHMDNVNASLKDEVVNIRIEATKYKTLCREQTEADLMAVSLRIVFETLGGKKKEELQTLVSEQTMYQLQLQRLMQPSSFHNNMMGASLLNSLGGATGIYSR